MDNATTVPEKGLPSTIKYSWELDQVPLALASGLISTGIFMVDGKLWRPLLLVGYSNRY